MRWTRPHCGATRYVKRFLWWPKTIGAQTRWLEWATWKEVYRCYELGQWWAPDRWLTS